MTAWIGPTRAEEDAVLSSVAYASLFDFPLTIDELRTALVGTAVDARTLRAWLTRSVRLQERLERHDDLVMLRGAGRLADVRRERERQTRALLARGRPALAGLVAMPFVRMVALSGSVAHGNADRDADLDLFVVTAPGRAWLVTVAALVLARLGGWRRMMCLNYVISERHLTLTPCDLFSANQLAHLCPIVDRFGVYARLLSANPFVGDFYPNFAPRPVRALVHLPRWAAATSRAIEWSLDWTLAALLDRVCHRLYRRHLDRRSPTWATKDQVRLERECLKLHTTSHRDEVLKRFDGLLSWLDTDAPAVTDRTDERLRASAR
jgi:hypothetical protein